MAADVFRGAEQREVNAPAQGAEIRRRREGAVQDDNLNGDNDLVHLGNIKRSGIVTIMTFSAGKIVQIDGLFTKPDLKESSEPLAL